MLELWVKPQRKSGKFSDIDDEAALEGSKSELKTFK
jgi:hypothetical protein